MDVPNSEELFLLEDWNGYVGPSSFSYEGFHGGYRYGKCNNKEDRILEFSLTNVLLVGNAHFVKR